MWDINDILLLMAIIYVTLGLAIGILISVRRRREKTSRSDHKKAQPATTIDHGTHIVNGRYEMKSPPFKQGGMATIWLAAELKTG